MGVAAIPVETRLAAPQTVSAQIQIDSTISARDIANFRRVLLRWYDANFRDLPWRKTGDPYRIWLSEIMLQQTRVAAVLAHYRIFLERFPNVQALAAASEDAVLAAWSGLGYYRRARMLHQCARQIVERYGGVFPRNSEALLSLPGIGRYTAAAIASIAFGEPSAVVDGNVERVLQRFTGIDLTMPQIWQQAQTLLAKSRPGDSNQAMMELGATVCVPREPRCLMCPVSKWCVTQGERPRTASISRQKKKEIWCVLDWRKGTDNNGNGKAKVRLVQRAKKALLMPGMWELPQSSEPPFLLPKSAPWRKFRHSITVTDYTVHVFRNPDAIVWGEGYAPSKWPPHKAVSKHGKWIAVDRFSQIPITGLTRKILKAGGII